MLLTFCQITQFYNPKGQNIKMNRVCLGEAEEMNFSVKQRHEIIERIER
jgi:hypothetical protein